MKKQLLIIALFLIIGTTNAQIFKAQVITGINISQVDGDEVYGYKKLGANVGLGVIFPVEKTKKWLVSVETLYNQKGAIAKKTAVDNFPQKWKYRLFLDYVETPFMMHYEDRGGFTAGIGFSWGRAIGVKEYENGTLVPTTTTTSGTYERSDWNFLADVRFKIYRQLKFNFRYAYSIVPIRERYFTKGLNPHWRNQYNNMLTFRLIYVINDGKQLKRTPKDKSAEK